MSLCPLQDQRSAPQKEQQPQQQQQAKAALPVTPEVGKPLGAPERNPLDLVKVRSGAVL